MLVLSRKKNEAILIAGLIRVEIVGLSTATARIRLTAPRELSPVRGHARQPLARPEPIGASESSVGLEVSLVTLVNQQILSLGKSISLGVLDADRSRVLLFVEAPPGTELQSQSRRIQKPDPQKPTSQDLLQFMKPGPEQAKSSPRNSGSEVIDSSGARPAEPEVPRLLPFPDSSANQARG